ncbi:MAG: hypothetical protein EXR88_02000 [Gammaproteobacteria bacterium]|nr:hypothetical protein [Gammaproteobacteria bacterium]
MRIAKSMLAVSTPFGVLLGFYEAFRIHWYLGTLMTAILSVLLAFTWLTVRRIHSERHRDLTAKQKST